MVSVPHSFYSHVFVDHVAAECLCFQQPTPAAPEACFPQRPRKPEVPRILHPPWWPPTQDRQMWDQESSRFLHTG